MVPFVAAMNRCLKECQLRANRPRLVTAVMTSTKAQFDADLTLMTDIAKSSGCTRYLYPSETPDVFFSRFELFRNASRTQQSPTPTRIYSIECWPRLTPRPERR